MRALNESYYNTKWGPAGHYNGVNQCFGTHTFPFNNEKYGYKIDKDSIHNPYGDNDRTDEKELNII